MSLVLLWSDVKIAWALISFVFIIAGCVMMYFVVTTRTGLERAHKRKPVKFYGLRKILADGALLQELCFVIGATSAFILGLLALRAPTTSLYVQSTALYAISGLFLLLLAFAASRVVALVFRLRAIFYVDDGPVEGS